MIKGANVLLSISRTPPFSPDSNHIDSSSFSAEFKALDFATVGNPPHRTHRWYQFRSSLTHDTSLSFCLQIRDVRNPSPHANEQPIKVVTPVAFVFASRIIPTIPSQHTSGPNCRPRRRIQRRSASFFISQFLFQVPLSALLTSSFCCHRLSFGRKNGFNRLQGRFSAAPLSIVAVILRHSLIAGRPFVAFRPPLSQPHHGNLVLPDQAT